eukprot:c13329_g1_i1.p1 GENE.c13329_g1_i1~~c13329_g1_i1.p1  ORF type:complete len:369 (-),score=45.82 c13329_g1_i1:21-1031(-)
MVRPASSYRATPRVGLFRSLVIVTIWVILISVLHIPVFFSLVSDSFPANNRFGMKPIVVRIMRGLISPWLVLSSEWLIPELSVWLTSKYYNYEQTSAYLELDLMSNRPKVPSHIRTSTEMVLLSQLFNLVVVPIVSQVLLHNRCMGVAGMLWEPCQDSSEFDVDVTTMIVISQSRPFNVTVPVLRRSQVCGSQFDAELCQRAVVASISMLVLSKLIYQTLFVLLRALMSIMITRHFRSMSTRKASVARVVVEPREHTTTRSIVSSLLLGFTLGGVAPFIWPAALVCVHSTILLWCCSSQRAHNLSPKLVGRRVVWFSILGQVGLGLWFVIANQWRD